MVKSTLKITLHPRWIILLASMHLNPLTYALNNSSSICESLGRPQDGLFITPDCIDPTYSNPIIDSQSNETFPSQHLRVGGYFENTTTRFSIYLPSKDAWDGRFYQYVYPLYSEVASNVTIGFGLDSRAYTVQVTGAQGYRTEAAAAKFSRTVARQYYGTDDPIYGYIYGASGGSLQTIGAMENTADIWHGAVAMVQAIPISVGGSQAMRPMLGLVMQNKSSEIQDVFKPGGSGDPYQLLNEYQQDTLREIELLGFPLRTLEDFYHAVNGILLSAIRGPFLSIDPSYATDFWTKEGYLGAEQSPMGDLMRKAVIEFNATVTNIERNAEGVPTRVLLENSSTPNPLKYDDFGYQFTLLSANGTALGYLIGQYNQQSSLVTFDVAEAADNDASLYPLLSPGIMVHVSTRDWVALHAWYRYQVPSLATDRNYIGYNHLRTANGSSIYPVRPLNVAQTFGKNSAGGAEHSGKINGKMIVLQNLLDFDAFPWWAHWYAEQVRSSLGEAGFEDSYRIWYQENADHEINFTGEREMLVVDYRLVCQQALRDLSAWVERGVEPPASTKYWITERNGVEVAEEAGVRGGVQPTVRLRVVGDGAVEGDDNVFRTGDEVVFEVLAEAPPGAGPIVDVEWNFYSSGDFAKGEIGQAGETLKIQRRHTYQEPGDYIAVVRVTVQREGNAETQYARVMNLGRVSVRVI